MILVVLTSGQNNWKIIPTIIFFRAILNVTNSSAVQNAIETIKVFTDFIDAIREAEAEANRAKESADKAFKVPSMLWDWLPSTYNQSYTNKYVTISHNSIYIC